MSKRISIKRVEDVEECKICNAFLSELILYEKSFDESILPRTIIADHYERTLNRDDSVIFLAKLNDESIGYVMAYKNEPKPTLKGNFVTIMNLYVKPEHRGVGAGKLLIEYVEKWAKEQFLTCSIELDCFSDNKSALEFYSKLNFKPKRIKMRKKI